MSATLDWTRERLSELLLRSDAAVERALVVLHDRQTATEQATLTTKDANGVGFGAFDADIFSSFAERVKRGFHLSPRQLQICRKATGKSGIPRIARYWKQLAAVAAEKQTGVSPKVIADQHRELEREVERQFEPSPVDEQAAYLASLAPKVEERQLENCDAW
jgi:hypothetical protein